MTAFFLIFPLKHLPLPSHACHMSQPLVIFVCRMPNCFCDTPVFFHRSTDKLLLLWICHVVYEPVFINRHHSYIDLRSHILCSVTSRRCLGPTLHPIRQLPETLSLWSSDRGVKPTTPAPDTEVTSTCCYIFMSACTFMACTETPFLVMTYTRPFSGPAIAAPGGRNARLANLWRAGRFPWHAAFTAATIVCIYIGRPVSLNCAVHVYIYTHI